MRSTGNCRRNWAALLLGGCSVALAAPESAEPAWKHAIGGSFQFDLGRVDGDDGRASDSVSAWRRKRLGLTLERLTGGFRFDLAAEYDFEPREWTDVVLRIKDIGPGQLLVGQFKQPFGMDELVSDKRALFVETALPTSFALGRRQGIGYLWNPGAHGLQGSVFDRNLNGVESTSGVALRGWWNPRLDAGDVVHLGLALTDEDVDDDRIGFSARPDTRLSAIRVARTPTFTDASGLRRSALEFAAVQGRWHVMGELLRIDVERRGGADFSGHGGYLQAGWLCGERSRGYKAGVLQGPAEGGVLELGARIDRIDLDDGTVAGGSARGYGLVATWYFKPETRLLANYVYVDRRSGSAAAVASDPRTFELRLQYVF